MNYFTILLPLGVVLVSFPTILSLQLVKCCQRGEELNYNLTLCQKVNSTNEIIYENSSFVTNEDITVNNYDETVDGISDPNEFRWLPEQLRIHRGKYDLSGKQNNCNSSRTVRLQIPRDEDRMNWLPNGTLILSSYTALGKFENRTFHPREYCTDTFTDKNGTQQLGLLLCPCDRMSCLKKCCPLGEALTCDDYDCTCKEYSGKWEPFYKDKPEPSEDFSFEIVVDRNLSCGEDFQDLVYVFDGYPLFLLHRFWSEMLKDSNMCGDTIVGLSDSPRQGITKCSPELPFPKAYVLVNWLHIPEAVFLVVTLLVTCIVPRRRLSAYSYVHDMSLVWHAASLLGRCLLWSVYLKAKWSCSVIPIFIYFFSMAASFWLNVLCLNMVCGFWKPLGVQHRRWGRARHMFALYALYAWGSAAAISAFTAAMWFSRRAPPALLRPTLHETRTCFREEEGDGKMATFAYYYGPVGGLLCVNALLFCCTALRVRALRRGSAMLSDKAGSSSRTSLRAQRSVIIYIKLLWLMGVLEMAVEAVAWISNSNEYYFAIAGSCLDVVRAVAIFVLCCCKKRTLVATRDRIYAYSLRCLPRQFSSKRTKKETDMHIGKRGSNKTISDASETTVGDSVCSVMCSESS